MPGGREKADGRPGSPRADAPDFVQYPFYQFRESCRWGRDCDRRRRNVCSFKHPGDEGYVAARLIRCRFGNSCVFLEAGSCFYYHESRAQQHSTQRSGKAASPERRIEMEESGSREEGSVGGSFFGRSVRKDSARRERSISISPTRKSRLVSGTEGSGSLLKKRSRSCSRGRTETVDGRYRDDDGRWMYDRGDTDGVRAMTASSRSRSRSRSRGRSTSASSSGRDTLRGGGENRAARTVGSREGDRERGADDSKFLMDVIRLQQETIMRLTRERDAAVRAAKEATPIAIFTPSSSRTAADALPATAINTLLPAAFLTSEHSSYMLPHTDNDHSHKYSSSSHYTYVPLTAAGYATQGNRTTVSQVDASPRWTHMHASTRPPDVEDRLSISRDDKAYHESGTPDIRTGSPW